MYHLFHKKIDRRPAYLAVGLLAVILMVAGYFAMDHFIGELVKGLSSTSAVATRPVAPTNVEYDSQAETVMRPFITYLASHNASVPVGDEMVKGLVQSAQQFMLGMRVPAERRDAHFAAVTLLDSWRAYLSGNDGDYDTLLSKTQQLTQDSPWLLLNVVR